MAKSNIKIRRASCEAGRELGQLADPDRLGPA